MDHAVVWQTAAGNYALLIDLAKREGGRVSLGSSREFQEKGQVRLFCQKNGRREPLETIKITGLPAKPPGEAVAFLSGTCTGGGVRILVEAGGKTLYSSVLTVPRFARPAGSAGRSKTKYLLLALPVLLAVIGLSFLAVLKKPAPTGGTGSTVQAAPPAQAVPLAKTPAAPNPPDSQKTGQPGDSSSVAANLPPGGDSSSVAANLPPGRNNSQAAVNSPAVPAEAPLFQPVTVYFMPEMAEIIPESQKKLEDLAKSLAGRDLRDLEITGHCALFGTEGSRVELSQKRAENTAAFLVRLGLEIPREALIIGEGGTRPATRNPDMQELNRRVEIRLNTRRR